MLPTKNLPANYQLHHTLNLSGKRVILVLNIIALPLLYLFGWLFSHLITILRSINPFPKGGWEIITAFSGWGLLALPLSIIFMLVFHELIHGLFFWLFTHHRPRFALKSGYAFAAAPEWFLPRAQYISVGLSPLVLISFLSLLIAWIAPESMLPYLLLIATFNAAGSLGDMVVTGWTLNQPAIALINDRGDIFSSFVPHEE